VHPISHAGRPALRDALKRVLRGTVTSLGPWFIALGMFLLRVLCRVRIHDDPRSKLRSDGIPYVYSVLHAHQIAAATCRESGTAAMVSQSKDGDFVAVGLRLAGIKTIRGSSRRGNEDKGGLSALNELVAHVRTGLPAYLAVDGPRGPRNQVHKGIAALSKQTGAVVLNVVAVPTRRWIFKRSWDRFQIPKPFCRIDIFVESIWPLAEESVEDYSRRIERSLCELEMSCDMAEAQIATARRRTAAR
jgi:lysophospholipid acyltransferase (LPLAT)-like uncharacterized protein